LGVALRRSSSTCVGSPFGSPNLVSFVNEKLAKISLSHRRPRTALGLSRRAPCHGVAFPPLTGHTRGVTADQLEMISTDPGVMHGQAVIAGTRVPVSVILDGLAAGMTAEEITSEYPTVTVAGVRAAAAYGAALAREELLPLPQSR
jgi:uncharacterized protein (DUF433 family)